MDMAYPDVYTPRRDDGSASQKYRYEPVTQIARELAAREQGARVRRKHVYKVGIARRARGKERERLIKIGRRRR